MLSDWTNEQPARVLAKLKKQSNYYNFNQPTLGDLVGEARQLGLGEALSRRAMWGQMRMSPTDLADVSGHTYTYLMNGQPPGVNWTGLFKTGEKIRLRFINGSAMTLFDVRIPGLSLTVIAADGQPVQPVVVDEFRIGVAETFDVLVAPEGDGPYTVFAQSMDRTGFARGTLATVSGMAAPVPALDAPVALTMNDMGHDMSAMDHDMSTMPDMAPVLHPSTESGPFVDMQVSNPVSRLNDPGIGLRNNGRRVLTYGDLHSAFPDPDGREPTQTVELHLTGHMERYVWSFNGVRSSEAEPILLTQGTRVRFVLINDGMMTHPIHLHGMWSDLEDDQGRFKVRKHTIVVQSGQRLSYRVSADALGRWAFHCHLMMHMESGMFREVRVDG